MNLKRITLKMKSFFRTFRNFVKRNWPEVLLFISLIAAFIFGGIITLNISPSDTLPVATFILGGWTYLLALLFFLVLLCLIIMLILLIVYVVVSAFYIITSIIRKIQIYYYTKALQALQKKDDK